MKKFCRLQAIFMILGESLFLFIHVSCIQDGRIAKFWTKKFKDADDKKRQQKERCEF